MSDFNEYMKKLKQLRLKQLELQKHTEKLFINKKEKDFSNSKSYRRWQRRRRKNRKKKSKV